MNTLSLLGASIHARRFHDKERSRKVSFRNFEHRNYFSLAYSDFAAARAGMSGSASFQSVKKSLEAVFALAVSPERA